MKKTLLFLKTHCDFLAVEDKIADLILSGTIGEGSTVNVDVHGKDLLIQ